MVLPPLIHWTVETRMNADWSPSSYWLLMTWRQIRAFPRTATFWLDWVQIYKNISCNECIALQPLKNNVWEGLGGHQVSLSLTSLTVGTLSEIWHFSLSPIRSQLIVIWGVIWTHAAEQHLCYWNSRFPKCVVVYFILENSLPVIGVTFVGVYIH